MPSVVIVGLPTRGAAAGMAVGMAVVVVVVAVVGEAVP
jgi:hypothetical protein